MWGIGSQDVNEAREEELFTDFFKPALDLGARMVRHYDTTQSAHNIIRGIVGNRPVVLQIQRELVDERKDIVDTAAGESIMPELKEQIRRHQAELKELRRDLMQTLNAKDKETKRELEEEKRKLQGWMEKITRDLERMSTNYAAEKDRIDARMREMEGKAEKRERDEVKYKPKLLDLTRCLQDDTGVSVANRGTSRKQMKKSQDPVGFPVTIPTDEPARHNTPGPQISSLLISYVHVLFRLAVHDG